MHLIILKWFKRQTCRQKRKTMRKKDAKTKDEVVYEDICESFFVRVNM